MNLKNFDIRTISKEEINFLYIKFNSGRPLNFFSPAAPGGFSLVAGLFNFLEKINKVERTPDWVRQVCETARRELTEAAMLLPRASRIPTIGTGPIFEVSNDGTFICAHEKNNGVGRVALLLAGQKAWLIAAWDGKSGEAVALPTLGQSITIPIEFDKTFVKRKIKAASTQAHEEVGRMQKKTNEEAQIFFQDGIVIILFLLMFIWLFIWLTSSR